MTAILDSPAKKILAASSGRAQCSYFPWIRRNILAIWLGRPLDRGAQRGRPMIGKTCAHRGLRMGLLLSAVVLPAAFAVAAGTEGAPDFSGRWGRNAFNFEPLPGQPLPVDNLKRTPTGQQDNNALVGDHKNPILKPQAAEIVRQKGRNLAQRQRVPRSVQPVLSLSAAVCAFDAARLGDPSGEGPDHLPLQSGRSGAPRALEQHASRKGHAHLDGQFHRPL